MSSNIDFDTWHESPQVSVEEFTIEFLEQHLAAAKAKGATEFRTNTIKDTEPWKMKVVFFGLIDSEGEVV